MSLSDAMQELLDQAAEAGGGVRMGSLVNERMRTRDQSESVARASLSRTVRRMWERGLVELHGSRSCTATEKHEQAAARYERVRQDPEGEYKRFVAWWRAMSSKPPPHDSPEELQEHMKRAAESVPPLYVRRVELTEKGREATDVPVKSRASAKVNREAALRRAMEAVGWEGT